MMFGSGTSLVTTIIGFGMSTTFIVFVCTRLICGRLRRQQQQQQLIDMDSGIGIDLDHLSQSRINGLEQVVVDAIPTIKFNREAFSCMEDIQCAICLSEYEEKEVVRIMPKCGHSFHLSCIDTWLRKQSTCPVCRLSVQPSGEVKGTPIPMPQSFEGSEITPQHSRQRQLSEGTASDHLSHMVSGSNEVRMEISSQVPSRSL
ncbi:RING-H2 finger protein ATL67-like [Andrographis paniculata]|uniref:RING-H2 finger protein ATL67-like n=1 Tax=Andrographis paniculata TaxID=175694 RepID=UPI0021E7A632|nr:RING-H2 finger protein ATL67-like [Andrographis paniculata]